MTDIIDDICKACEAKCCKISGVYFTKEEKESIEKAGHTEFFTRDDEYFEMKHQDGICVFIKDDRCSVYEYRPAMCRAFPVYPTGEETIIIPCDLAAKLDTSDCLTLREAAARVPRKFANTDISMLPEAIQERNYELGWPRGLRKN